METVPNRAAHPNRVMGDHTTPMVQLHPNMRPSGISYDVYEHEPYHGAMGNHPIASPMYETGSAERTHELINSQVETLKDKPGRHSLVGTVNYHPDDVEREASRETASTVAKDPRFDPSHSQYVHSGTDRLMIQSQMQEQAKSRLAKSNFMVHNF